MLLVANDAEVDDFTVGSTLGGFLSTASPPELDIGDLRDLLHFEQTVQHRIVEPHVFDRVFRWRQYSGDLGLPLFPRRRPPEVVSPQEPAFEEVGSQPLRLIISDANGPGI